jgi:hypothetical protein
MVNGGIQRR